MNNRIEGRYKLKDSLKKRAEIVSRDRELFCLLLYTNTFIMMSWIIQSSPFIMKSVIMSVLSVLLRFFITINSLDCWLVGFINATFNNISVISWGQFLMVEETGGPGETHWPLPQVTDKLYHIILYSLPWVGVEPITSVVIGTNCISSCKSNYHTITTRMDSLDSLEYTCASSLVILKHSFTCSLIISLNME